MYNGNEALSASLTPSRTRCLYAHACVCVNGRLHKVPWDSRKGSVLEGVYLFVTTIKSSPTEDSLSRMAANEPLRRPLPTS